MTKSEIRNQKDEGASDSALFVIRDSFGFLVSGFVIVQIWRRGGTQWDGRTIPRPALSGRNGVITTASPWMATADAANAHPRPAERTMGFHSFQKILRAGGLVATTRSRTAQFVQNRGEKLLIAADEKTENPLHGGSRRWRWRGQQAGAAGEFDPFRFERLKLRSDGVMAGNGDDQMRGSEVWKLTGNDGGEAAAHFIADHRIPETAGDREPKPAVGLLRNRQGCDNKQATGPRSSLPADSAEFSGAADAPGTGKGHEASAHAHHPAQACVWRA